MDRGNRHAVLECGEDARVDVRVLRHRRSVAESVGHPLHDVADHRGVFSRVAPFALDREQSGGGEQRASPRAEVLRREVAAHMPLDVRVHSPAVDVVDGPVLIEEAEDLVPRHLVESAYHVDELRIADRLDVALTALADEVEGHAGRGDVGVLAPERRDPVVLVLPGVLGIADTEELLVDQFDDAGDDLVLAESAPAQVVVQLLPQPW